MKKKVLSLALCLALAATAVVGGTLAYFTDTDEATNTFTVGNVKIDQYEKERKDATSNELQEFTQDETIYPAIHDKLTPKKDITVDGYEFEIRDLAGNYNDKIVNVQNKGTEQAYIRTIIAIPNMNGYDDADDATYNPLHWNYLDATDFNGTGWNWSGTKNGAAGTQTDKVANVTIGGKSYDIYVATYNTAVASGSFTSPSLVGFYLDQSVNCDENGYFYVNANKEKVSLSDWMKIDEETGKCKLNILVASQACQTAGFADAWEALDECFGDITATNHPWAE